MFMTLRYVLESDFYQVERILFELEALGRKFVCVYCDVNEDVPIRTMNLRQESVPVDEKRYSTLSQPAAGC